MNFKNAVEHFKTITRHRHQVMKNCFRAGIPWQGLLHDLSKYSPAEFLVGVKYYQGTRSPNIAEREQNGYSSAWLRHKGRNKHHYEYWFDNDAKTLTIQPVEMPVNYVVEMFCDRIAASKIYKKDTYNNRVPLEYFNSYDYQAAMHPATREQLCTLLTMLAEKGERKTYKYIRKLIRDAKRELRK